VDRRVGAVDLRHSASSSRPCVQLLRLRQNAGLSNPRVSPALRWARSCLCRERQATGPLPRLATVCRPAPSQANATASCRHVRHSLRIPWPSRVASVGLLAEAHAVPTLCCERPAPSRSARFVISTRLLALACLLQWPSRHVSTIASKWWAFIRPATNEP